MEKTWRDYKREEQNEYTSANEVIVVLYIAY